MKNTHDSTYRRGRKRVQKGIDDRRGNIGGLVVWGGALAVTSLFAAFAVRKCMRRDGNKDQGKIEDKASLRSIPSTTFQHNPCCEERGSTKLVETQIESCELVSIKSLALEEDPTPVIHGANGNSASSHQEILLADDSKQESTTCDDCCDDEENSWPVTDGPLCEVENRIKNNSGDDLVVMKRNEISEEEEAVDTKVTLEETSSMHSIKKGVGEREEKDHQKDEEGFVDHVIEREEESSEGTGSTSAESNVGTIWSAESIEVVSPEFKNNILVNQSNLGEKIVEGDRTAKTKECGEINSGKSNIYDYETENGEITEKPMLLEKKRTQEAVEGNDQTAHSARWRICAWSILALLLVLLLYCSGSVRHHLNRDCFLVP